MSRAVLVGSLGLPGSGKSTFLNRFCADQHWFYFRNDDARRQIYKQPRHDRKEREQLGRLAHYVFNQLLELGISCAYDVNLNQRRHRDDLNALAAAHGAEFWLLWVNVTPEVAKQRVKDRADAATGEEKAYFDTFHPHVVEIMQQRLEPPGAGEKVIEIDGTAPYEEQLAAVKRVLELP